jgi:membrane-associated phospholipid phosphatase
LLRDARYRLTMAKSIKAPVTAWLGCACALVLLVLAAYRLGPVERLDASLLSRLVAQRGSSTVSIAEVFVHLADPLPLIAMLLVVCGLGVRWGRRREAVAALAVVAGANLTTQILKVLLAHPRYEPILGPYSPLATAFPSGHVTAAASIAVALLLVAPRRLRPAAAAVGVALVVLVSVSVLVLEWHFPSDVLGGLLVAAGWGFAAVAGLRVVRRLGSAPEAQASSRFAISLK